ncbi:MAG: hypothetical protein ABI140_00925 [Jatrophihabitantaceae bacterium]
MRLLCAAASAVVGGVLLAAPAAASTPIAFSFAGCETDLVTAVGCTADWSGGTGPYTASWTTASAGRVVVTGVSTVEIDSQSGTWQSNASIRCTSSSTTGQARIVVTDATGAQATKIMTFSCAVH